MATPLSRQSSTSSGRCPCRLDRPADLEPAAVLLQGAVLHRVGRRAHAGRARRSGCDRRRAARAGRRRSPGRPAGRGPAARGGSSSARSTVLAWRRPTRLCTRPRAASRSEGLRRPRPCRGSAGRWPDDGQQVAACGGSARRSARAAGASARVRLVTSTKVTTTPSTAPVRVAVGRQPHEVVGLAVAVPSTRRSIARRRPGPRRCPAPRSGRRTGWRCR